MVNLHEKIIDTDHSPESKEMALTLLSVVAAIDETKSIHPAKIMAQLLQWYSTIEPSVDILVLTARAVEATTQLLPIITADQMVFTDNHLTKMGVLMANDWRRDILYNQPHLN